MTFGRVLGVLLLVMLAGLAGFVALAWRPEIDAIEPRAPASFDRALVERGAGLARIGNCATCHTAPGGAPFAGGRAVETQFGVIYGTNITPDAETGIGRWSQSAFARAMRDGVAREGRHLYPAFPYDHFRLVTDDDLNALYAYVMTREPVRAEPPQSRLGFPFNMRPLLAGWKLFFLGPDAFEPRQEQGPEWNRGAYLAHGLAHCGSCHTPRNFLGGEKRGERFAGGSAGGWDGPALGAASPAPRQWTVERLYSYLRRGIDDAHSAAAGPMKEVVHNLAEAPEADVRSIAVYVASLMPQRDEGSAAAGGTAAEPTGLYEQACAGCHRGREAGGALHLGAATQLYLPRPRNLLNVIREGIVPREGEAGPWMPAYGGAFTDEQLAALANELRTGLAGRPAWDKVEP